ncbi:hypothetical protein DFH28DRAFT_1216400 [Melampsora americana]|nr:hypothetical protein DFH28DRAFT_1216400 [Melampsora americana]
MSNSSHRSRMLVLCMIFFLNRIFASISTSRRSEVHRTHCDFPSHATRTFGHSPVLAKRQLSSGLSSRPTLRRANSIARFIRHSDPDQIKCDQVMLEKQESIDRINSKHILHFRVPSDEEWSKDSRSSPDRRDRGVEMKTIYPIHPSLTSKPKPKVGLFGKINNLGRKIKRSMEGVASSILTFILNLFKKTEGASDVKTTETGLSSAEYADLENVNPFEALKLLAWELVVNPCKQDRVVGDLFDQGEPKNWKPYFRTLIGGPGTKRLKTIFVAQMDNLKISDPVSLAEKHPGGWDEFVQTLTSPEQQKAVEEFQIKLKQTLAKIPASKRKNIIIYAKIYRKERLEGTENKLNLIHTQHQLKTDNLKI